MDKKNFANRMLQLTLEIIYLLTGEDYIIMRKSGDHGTSRKEQGLVIAESPPPSPKEQNILEVAKSIIHLLTGEVLGLVEDSEAMTDEQQPLSCQGTLRRRSKTEIPPLANHCDEREHVDGSHRRSKFSKDHVGSALVKRRASKIRGLRGVDTFQVCPPTPSSRDGRAAIYASDAEDGQLVQLEELESREEGALEEGLLIGLKRRNVAKAEPSTPKNALQRRSRSHKSRETSNAIKHHKGAAYMLVNFEGESESGEQRHLFKIKTLKAGDDESKGIDPPKMGPSLHSLNDSEDLIRLSSPPGPKSLSYQCPECPDFYDRLSELLQHQTTHQEEPMPSSNRGPTFSAQDQKDLDYFLVEIKEEFEGTDKEDLENEDPESETSSVEEVQFEVSEEEEFEGDNDDTLDSPTDDENSASEFTVRAPTDNENSKAEFTVRAPTNGKNSKDEFTVRAPTNGKNSKDEFTVRASTNEENSTAEFTVRALIDDENLTGKLILSSPTNGENSKAEFILNPPNNAKNSTVEHFVRAPTDDGNSFADGVASSTDHVGTSSSTIPNAMIYKCLECPDVFNCRSDLLKHQTHHRGSMLFTCLICQKNFTSKSNLAKHQKIHTGEKPYSCTECGKCFREKHYLITHQSVHKGAQLITCPVCGKGYTSKSNLAKHQRIHTGQKPFACSICCKSFNQRSLLLVHQRTHTGEKPFECHLCLRRFTDKLQLERHQITHTGEKPFCCSVCGKSFSRKNTLVKHLSSH